MTQYEKMHVPVVVSATFSGTKPKIDKFVWNNTDYIVEHVQLISRARKGREVVWIFNVSTKTGAYKLRFDTDSLSWWLEEISWEE